MTTIYSKSESANPIANSPKVIKLTGLTPRQRDLLIKGSIGIPSIIGAGALITSLSSATSVDTAQSKEPVIHESAPLASDVSNTETFESAFSHARAEVGAGGIFTWKGNDYNTYYKEEWDAMTIDQKNDYLSSLNEGVGQNYEDHNCLASCTIEIPTDFEIAKNVNDSMSFDDAFSHARSECGSNGLFNWHGNTYNTFTKEEFANFSVEEKQSLAANIHNSTEWQTLSIDNTENGVACACETQNHEFITDPINYHQDINPSDNLHEQHDVINIDETHPVSNTSDNHIVTLDSNHDSNIEAIVADTNDDNYADLIVYDENGNQIPDLYLVNSDNNHSLDIGIADTNENGIDNQDEVVKLPETELKMDEIDHNQIHSDNHIEHHSDDTSFDSHSSHDDFNGI